MMDAGKFSRYELREELGRGGMATVYRAYDPLFEREVALKILKQELLENMHLRERFERETKIIAKLEHAAIVPVYDVGNDNNQLFFVMRYMAGGSLVERIQDRSLSLSEIAHIIQRVAAALDYAHNKGVIHRDLKPGNILFDEYNNAYISDFGIAKLTHASVKLTNSGIIGTPTHMSPEQAMGEEVDERSDIYSLGVILFEMLSGKTPYEATTPLGMAFKHASDPVPHILKINPNLPDGIETVIEKVMAKNRDERYSSGTEFANAFITTMPGVLPPDANLVTPPPPARIAVTPPPTPPTPFTATPIPQPAPPISRFGIPGVFIVLTLAAFAFWGYPRFINSIESTPQPATLTSAPPTSTSTSLPASTATQMPTEAVTPTVPVSLGIGGADKIALTANDDIYIMDIDGSNINQLTNTNIPKFDLQWLPGGNEILYGERNCVYKINVDSVQAESEEVACFNEGKFEGFRVSPDGMQMAIGIERRLLVLPFDMQMLSDVTSAFELQGSEDLCLDYADVAVKGARWSADGQALAIVYQSVVNQRIGDTIRVIEADTQRCQAVDPLIMDEFPAKRFVPEGYERYPVLPFYNWDGNQQFLFNSLKRNVGYGELYLYDISTNMADKINPVDGICCYGTAAFSPDGTHILLVFQDERLGADSESQLYYIPVDQINSSVEFVPVRLPLQFFPDLRESIQLALRPSVP
ncbi:MAG: protein kinase [Chloroflexota bacterium]|nr:protein kinase [Chloroflexota bacterium]